MSIATATNNWKSYKIGSVVRIGDDNWTITNITRKATGGGYTSREFELTGPNGETVTKSSRGLTLWVQSGSSEPVVADVEADDEFAVADKSATGDILAQAIASALSA